MDDAAAATALPPVKAMRSDSKYYQTRLDPLCAAQKLSRRGERGKGSRCVYVEGYRRAGLSKMTTFQFIWPISSDRFFMAVESEFGKTSYANYQLLGPCRGGSAPEFQPGTEWIVPSCVFSMVTMLSLGCGQSTVSLARSSTMSTSTTASCVGSGCGGGCCCFGASTMSLQTGSTRISFISSFTYTRKYGVAGRSAGSRSKISRLSLTSVT